MIRLFNKVTSRAFDLVLAPFEHLSPIIGIGVLALLASAGMLLVFKATSNQSRLLETKRQIHAGVYEIRLFRDDAPAILRAQLGIIGQSFKYLWLSLPPMLWIVLPFFLLIAQLQFRFGYAGLEPGDRTIVKATLVADEARPMLALEPGPGLTVDAPMLWIPVLGEANWRIRVLQPGRHAVRLEVGADTLLKSVDSSPGILRRSPVRPSDGAWAQMLYPGEAPLPSASPVASLTVDYPALRVSLFGWRTHWLVAFLILVFAFTLVLRRPLRVTI